MTEQTPLYEVFQDTGSEERLLYLDKSGVLIWLNPKEDGYKAEEKTFLKKKNYPEVYRCQVSREVFEDAQKRIRAGEILEHGDFDDGVDS